MNESEYPDINKKKLLHNVMQKENDLLFLKIIRQESMIRFSIVIAVCVWTIALLV